MRHAFRIALLAGVGLVPVLFALIFLFLFSPRIDEILGVFTRHALASVQNHQEQGRTVREIVAARYRDPRWRAYHADDVTDTYVRCEALRVDGTPITLQWFVRAVPRVGFGLRLGNTIVTAINQDALDVAPSLFEPGHPIYRSPDVAY